MFKSIKMVVHRPVYENLANELREMWPEGEVSEEEHHIISSALKQLNFIVKGRKFNFSVIGRLPFLILN